jgi:hypothetical protein
MVPPLPPSMLARLFGRRPTPPREPEPADMGTAFGLDQTLDRPDGYRAPAPDEHPLAWLPGSRRPPR